MAIDRSAGGRECYPAAAEAERLWADVRETAAVLGSEVTSPPNATEGRGVIVAREASVDGAALAECRLVGSYRTSGTHGRMSTTFDETVCSFGLAGASIGVLGDYREDLGGWFLNIQSRYPESCSGRDGPDDDLTVFTTERTFKRRFAELITSCTRLEELGAVP